MTCQQGKTDRMAERVYNIVKTTNNRLKPLFLFIIFRSFTYLLDFPYTTIPYQMKQQVSSYTIEKQTRKHPNRCSRAFAYTVL